MPLFHHNQPNHSLLLMSVRLGSERLPKNKVRLLSCDVEGHLFTQLVGRSTYQHIKKETQQVGVSPNNYATIYWDNGANKLTPLVVEIGEKDTWALERILEHAFRSAIIPDVLKRYPKEIIKLGESKQQRFLTRINRETRKATAVTSSRVLDRLPYYRKQDIEVSIPIYKANYTFPLIILKRLPQEKTAPPGQHRLLVLDSDGDIAVNTLPSEQIDKAERKLNNLRRKGKTGYLICLRKNEGISVDVMEMSELQRQALETVTQYFEETGKGKHPLSGDIRKILNKAQETV